MNCLSMAAAAAPKSVGVPPICVLKFGSSVLEREADYANVALEVYRHVREGEKVVAVVSAVAGHTDELLAQGQRLGGGSGAHDEILARLCRIGEMQSAAVLTLALGAIGVPADTLDPHEIGLTAEGTPLDSNLVDLDAQVIVNRFASVDAIVVPGFIANHAKHGVVTLGRGGTDLSAVFIAGRLGARRVRLIKNVDGVYVEDPAVNPVSERFSQLSFKDAEKASGGLIQVKAIREAKADDLIIEVAALGAAVATEIGHVQARKDRPQSPRRLRVLLLGCGAVGGGVLAHLRSRQDLFEIGPVLIQQPEIHGGDAEFVTSPEAALRFCPDIIVELIGGTGLASELMKAGLMRGASVVTANKAALAANWDELHRCISDGGSTLRFSASVGGGAPIVETIRRLKGQVVAIEGIMNGTCNFLLERLREGSSLEDALRRARELGFAEADPSADVDGHDVAAKLAILSREAFGAQPFENQVHMESLRDLPAESIQSAAAKGNVIKQVGRCRVLDNGSVKAEVRLDCLPAAHPLAGVKDEHNCFLVTLATGEVHTIKGKGAGRWPTAASVFSDIMDVQRALVSRERLEARQRA